jgi:hypothetical protein
LSPETEDADVLVTVVLDEFDDPGHFLVEAGVEPVGASGADPHQTQDCRQSRECELD